MPNFLSSNNFIKNLKFIITENFDYIQATKSNMFTKELD